MRKSFRSVLINQESQSNLENMLSSYFLRRTILTLCFQEFQFSSREKSKKVFQFIQKNVKGKETISDKQISLEKASQFMLLVRKGSMLANGEGPKFSKFITKFSIMRECMLETETLLLMKSSSMKRMMVMRFLKRKMKKSSERYKYSSQMITKRKMSSSIQKFLVLKTYA